MKSWADHCSSDEESDDGIHHPARGDVPAIMENVVEEEEEVNDEGSFHEENDGGPPPPVEGDYSHLEFPSKPPFTAHLSNLNFKIKDEEALCHHVETMVDYRYRMRGKGLVHAVNARFGTDRATGSRKGFGYVDVQSLDEVSTIISLHFILAISVYFFCQQFLYIYIFEIQPEYLFRYFAIVKKIM